jgi:muramidase (phage lysozyme)
MSEINPQARRWLEAISGAEGTQRADPAESYRVLFGGGLFDPSKTQGQHPDRVVRTPGYSSAAAGKYQFMPATYKEVAAKLGLKDFSARSQDLAALEKIRERGVDPYKEKITPQTLAKLAPEWASLPTLEGKSYYGQPVKTLNEILEFADRAGRPETKKAVTGQTALKGDQDRSPAQAVTERIKSGLRPSRDFFRDLIKQVQGTFGTVPNQSTKIQRDTSPTLADYTAAIDKAYAEGKDELGEALEEASLTASLTPSGARSRPDYAKDYLNLGLALARQQMSENTGLASPGKGDLKVASPDGPAFRPSPQQTPSQGFQQIALKDVIVTSPLDTSGEPGLDFVIPGGRGATFKSPFTAEVVEVRGDRPEEFRLEEGATQRGYGNYVDVRVTPPSGRPFEARIAHLDEVNKELKPGMTIPAGFPLGTQGRSGSTTGAHISMDLYDPGSTSTSDAVRKYISQFSDRLTLGKPLL